MIPRFAGASQTAHAWIYLRRPAQADKYAARFGKPRPENKPRKRAKCLITLFAFYSPDCASETVLWKTLQSNPESIFLHFYHLSAIAMVSCCAINGRRRRV